MQSTQIDPPIPTPTRTGHTYITHIPLKYYTELVNPNEAENTKITVNLTRTTEATAPYPNPKVAMLQLYVRAPYLDELPLAVGRLLQ